MKKFIAILMALSLMLAVCLSASAEDTAAATTETPAATEAADPSAADSTTTTPLQAAEEAYRAARDANRMTDYETELKNMVTAGQLTQEQADLLLNAAKERESLRSGTCPNCGYQFKTENRIQNGMGRDGFGRGHGGRH